MTTPTVSLKKDESVNLSKSSATPLTQVTVGLGWDPIAAKGLFAKLRAGGSIDLDASLIMFEGDNLYDTVFFQHLKSKDGSVEHTGDNLTGAGDGDDEQIVVALDRVSSNVDRLVITVSSYTGQTFRNVGNAFVRIVDDAARKELVRYNLTDAASDATGQIMGILARDNNQDWTFKALGQAVNSRTANDLVSAARNLTV